MKEEPVEPEIPDDGVRRELTPAEREQLGRLADRLRDLIALRESLKVPNIVHTSAFTKVVPNAAKFSSFILHGSTHKKILALAGFANLRARLLDSLRPALDFQGDWMKKIGLVNSDIFKIHAATQAGFAELGTKLTKNLDFGVFTKLGQQFAEQQSRWLKTLAPTLERLRESFYPPNLRSIKDLKFEEVEKVVLADGIALYGLPRAPVAEAIIRAETAAKRREILGRRWRTISADCREVLNGCASQSVAPYVPFTVAALDALDSGHTAPAQALAGSLIDTLLTARFGKDRYLYTPDKKGSRTTDAFDEFSVRQFVAFAPMLTALTEIPRFCSSKFPTLGRSAA